MISPAPASRKHQPYAAPVGSPRLLIVSDSAERLLKLRASLAADQIEITSAASPEELNRACRDGHDLVVIDVGPAQLTAVLTALREHDRYAQIPVLVEASRLAAEPNLAGVLPKYRAMPCSHAELIALARRRITANSARRSAKRVL
jgi:DNA-binding NtrC family response regulator